MAIPYRSFSPRPRNNRIQLPSLSTQLPELFRSDPPSSLLSVSEIVARSEASPRERKRDSENEEARNAICHQRKRLSLHNLEEGPTAPSPPLQRLEARENLHSLSDFEKVATLRKHSVRHYSVMSPERVRPEHSSFCAELHAEQYHAPRYSRNDTDRLAPPSSCGVTGYSPEQNHRTIPNQLPVQEPTNMRVALGEGYNASQPLNARLEKHSQNRSQFDNNLNTLFQDHPSQEATFIRNMRFSMGMVGSNHRLCVDFEHLQHQRRHYAQSESSNMEMHTSGLQMPHFTYPKNETAPSLPCLEDSHRHSAAAVYEPKSSPPCILEPLPTTGCYPDRKRRLNLPRESTTILDEWYRQHINHPYPKEEEKYQLHLQTGLSMLQVNNWFINARRRRRPRISPAQAT